MGGAVPNLCGWPIPPAGIFAWWEMPFPPAGRGARVCCSCCLCFILGLFISIYASVGDVNANVGSFKTWLPKCITGRALWNNTVQPVMNISKNYFFILRRAHRADVWFIAARAYLGLLRLPNFIHPWIVEIYIIPSDLPLHFQVLLMNGALLRWCVHLHVIYLTSPVFRNIAADEISHYVHTQKAEVRGFILSLNKPQN